MEKRAGLFGFLIVCTFLLLSDVAILLSQYPTLYGVTNANGTRFEESLLYLPLAKNFEFSQIGRQDFTGPNEVTGLGPIPYTVAVIARVANWISGGNPNLLILLLHSGILLSYLFLFFLLRISGCARGRSAIGALLILFGQDLVFHAYAFWEHFYADPIATRFFSPGLTFIFFYAYLAVLWRVDRRLTSGQGLRVQDAVSLALLLGANFYAYLYNWLLLLPMTAAWILLRRKNAFPYRGPIFIGVGVLALAAIPLVRVIWLGKTLPEWREYLARASYLGTETYHRFNYPPLKPLLLLLPLALLLFWGARRVSKKDRMPSYLAALLFVLSILFAYLNYLVPGVIPQSTLFHRFWIPLFLLSVFQIFSEREFKIERQVTPVALVLMLISLSALGAGRFRAHQEITGAAANRDAQALSKVVGLIDSETLFVSDQHPLQLLAPGVIGVKTLLYSPTMTPVSNLEIVKSYVYWAKILDWPRDSFLYNLGDIDRFGEVHETADVSNKILFMSQNRGLNYPIPSAWIDANQSEILSLFDQVTQEEILRRYPRMVVCLGPSTGPTSILNSGFDLVLDEADLRCWRRQ